MIVTGCWSQIEREQVIEIDGVDATFGIEAWREIAEHAGAVEAERDIPETSIGVGPSAYLKISDGCARPCTFCHIPGIKGRQFRSAQPDALVAEARELVARGAREIVLVAQDSTAYGAEWGDANGLARLIERLAAESGADWLRLMYAYPGFVTPSLVEVMAQTPQVCHYLDIPLQHGSPTVPAPDEAPAQHEHGARHARAAAHGHARHRHPHHIHRRLPRRDGVRVRGVARLRRRSRIRPRRRIRLLPATGNAGGGHVRPDRGIDQATPSRRVDGLARRGLGPQEQATGRPGGLSMLVESEPGQTTEGPATRSSPAGPYREAAEVDGLVFALGEANPGEFRTVEIVEAMGHDLWAEAID